MSGKVKRDLLDLAEFYKKSSTIKDVPTLRDYCQQVIATSVGTTSIKLKFVQLLILTESRNKMLKLITDYAMAGQGLGVKQMWVNQQR